MNQKHKNTLLAFLECYDLHGPGWPGIEAGMRTDFGVENPEEDLEEAREYLSEKLI